MNPDWTYKRIGDVCLVERGGSPRPIDDYITDAPDGINWIKIGDTSDSMFITKTAQKIKPEGMKKSRYVEPGDFLLSNSMSFGRPYILKIDGCIHDGWLVLRDGQGLFDKRFLYYYLSSPTTYRRFAAMAVGGVVNNLNSEMVRKVEVPVPSMDEQRKIANLLDKLNSVIESIRSELSLLDQLIKARFVEMFGDYQDIVQLSDVAEVTGGLTKNGNRDRLPLKLPYLRVANVSFASIDTTEMLSIGLTEEERSKTTLQYGDLLFVEGNGSPDQIGRVAIWHDEVVPCVHQNHIIKARLNESKMLPAFAMHYYMSQKGRDQIKKKAVSTSGLYTLSVSKISGFVMPCPPLDRQIEFAALVAQVDKSKVVEFSVFTKRAKSYII